MSSEKRFEQWCILEILGHQRFAGLVTEQSLGGSSFVRIDVPESDGKPAFTKLFGAGSIYCITPVTEEVARAMAKQLGQQPMSVWDIPESIKEKYRGLPVPAGGLPIDEEDDDFDDDDEM